MGNEMGNNNTSGFQEENNTKPEAQEKSFQEPAVLANGINGGNNDISTTEDEDYHQKETGLVSDNPKEAEDGPDNNQTSDGTGGSNAVSKTEVNDNHQNETGLSSDGPNEAGDGPDNNQTFDGTEESNVVSETEVTDYHEKETGLASDDTKEAGDGHDNDQGTNGTESRKNELHPPESTKTENNSDEGGKDTDIAAPDSLPNESADHENQETPDLEKEVSKVSTNQIEKESSFKKEEEALLYSASAETSSSHIPESEKSAEFKSDQHGILTQVHVDQREQDINDSLGSTEETNIPCNIEANVHLLDTYISNSDEGTAVSDVHLGADEKRNEILLKETEGDLSSKEKHLVQAETEDVDVEKRIGICSGTNSFESLIGESQPEDNHVLSEEAESSGTESVAADSNPDDNQSARESEIEKKIECQTDSLTGPNLKSNEMHSVQVADSNGNCHVEEVKIPEESNQQNCAFEAMATISNGKISEDRSEDCIQATTNGIFQVKEAKAIEQSDHQNGALDDHSEISNGKIVVVPQLDMLQDESFISNGKSDEEISEDIKAEPYMIPGATSNKNSQVEEANVLVQFNGHSDASHDSCIANGKQSAEKEPEESKPEAVADQGAESNGDFQIVKPKTVLSSESQNGHAEGKIMMVPELGTPQAVTTADGANKEEETSEKQIMEMKENTVAPDADETTCGEKWLPQPLPLPEMNSTPASEFQPEDLHYETTMKPENAQDSTDSVLDLKAESSINFSPATTTTFDATSSVEETLVSEVELAIEKTDVPARTEKVTETNFSASAHNSNEQLQQIATSIFASNAIQPQDNGDSLDIKQILGKKIQAEITKFQSTTTENKVITESAYNRQASVGRFSNESVPDYLSMPSEMRKSPSFDLNLRRSTEESDKTPLLYQDKNTIKGFSSSNPADISLQTSFPPAQYSHREESHKYQEVPVEEKVIMLERSDSNKSKTPFLSLLKEDEEANAAVTPKKQAVSAVPKKEIVTGTSKSKEKHKRRSSLFTHCMCCTTVIN